MADELIVAVHTVTPELSTHVTTPTLAPLALPCRRLDCSVVEPELDLALLEAT